MDTSPRYEKEDILINFRDLLVHILRRWRSVLIGMIVITLLLTGFQYVKDQNAYENALAAQKDEVAIIELDEASLANAEQVMHYQRLYQTQTAYNRDSLLMQIDPVAVPTQTLSYLITGKQAYVTAAIYQTHLSSRELFATIASAVAPQNDPSHIAELVSTWLQSDNGADAIADHVILNIKVIAPTEALCENIAAEVKLQMNTVETSAAGIGEHTLTFIAETAQVTVDNSLKTTQQNHLNNCTTLRNNLKTAQDALTANEKAYIQQMTALDEENTAAAPTPPSVSKKMVVLGIAAGLVLMAGLHALGYVFSRKVKSREDFAERYGLFVFGSINANDKKPAHRLFSKKKAATSEQDALALAQQQLILAVRAALNEKENAAVLIIGSTLDDNATVLFASLKEAAAKQGIALNVLPSALNDAAAFEQLADADAVVLAETLDASTYGDIYRELETCERLACPVLGAFILQ